MSDDPDVYIPRSEYRILSERSERLASLETDGYLQDDEARQWSTNDVLDAFSAAGFADHDAAIVTSLLIEARENGGSL